MTEARCERSAAERWELWNLRALMPHASEGTLDALHRRRREIEATTRALRRGDGRRVRELFDDAGAFFAAHPEIRDGLIVTLHMGPYSLLPGLWLAGGVEPAVVLDRAAHERLRDAAEAQRRELGLPGRIEWITTDRPLFAGRMLRALRAGRPVLVYLDGNSGDGGMEATRDRGMPYRLPGRTIRVRTGLGRLIERSGCSVHGVTVRWRSDGGLLWRAVRPGRWSGEAGARQITRQLYDWLFDEVARSPEQWSFWGMLARAGEAFAAVGRQEDPDPGERVRLRARFERALRDEAATARLVLVGRVEVWEPDILADLTTQRFWTAEGLRDADLDLFRRDTPTLAATAERFGDAWLRFHGLRLALLGLLAVRGAD